jgi:glycosyltransferase involved in cell wall biosynthesis
VRDLDVNWPAISVVVTAHNAADTIHETLSHCDRLDYPNLEVVVVNDGSTDSTPAIVAGHPAVELVTIPHSGLSAGRNAGYRAARGDLIAYLDADAYPSPEWPWYLAIAALDARVGGASGPNVPPPGETTSAQVVASSPGGPVPQLLGPDRAGQVPGCNMAYWRHVLDQLDGFDPSLRIAADDLEFEWRLRDYGYEIAYHPAALVWHHRRPGLRPYLRQQRNYGRSQAILERRYPERFPPGFRVRKAASLLRGRRHTKGNGHSYDVEYLTLPAQGGGVLNLAHQWGVPAAAALASTAPLALARRRLAAPAVAASIFLSTLFLIDVLVCEHGRRRAQLELGFRARLAAFRLLRPLAFRWGHLKGRLEGHPDQAARASRREMANAVSEGPSEATSRH